MKKFNISAAMLLLSILIFSCKKDGVKEIATTSTDGAAMIKFFNFGVNSPSVNFYANDAKISAVSSVTGSEAVTGLAYGSVFPATNYSLLPGGSYVIKGIVPSTAPTNPGVIIVTLASAVENGKFYSVYTCGIYNATTKSTDAFLVEDKIPATSATTASVRLVNTISNATAGFDLVAKNTTTLTEQIVARNVGYKGASDFTAVPNGVYELYARYANGTTNIISRNGTSTISFIQGRTYTVSTRGDMTVTGTTATNRPFLDNTSNRP